MQNSSEKPWKRATPSLSVWKILAQSETYWGAWYAAAQEISGIDQSYDDDGNAIIPSTGNEE